MASSPLLKNLPQITTSSASATKPQTLPQSSPQFGESFNSLQNIGGFQSTTPNQTNQGTLSNVVGALGQVASFFSQQDPADRSEPKIQPTANGGLKFDPAMSTGASTPVKASPQPLASKGSALDQYVEQSYQTPNGGTVKTDAGGNVTGFNPSTFSIDTSGATPSSALTSNLNQGDLTQKHSSYMDYVNGLAQAQNYSPEYLQALQQQQQAQTAGAQLNLNQGLINSNLQTGAGFTGFSTDQATTRTGQEQAQNSLNQGVNQIAQLSANQQMQVQALVRSGNIAAATALVQAAQPVGVSPGTSLVSPLNGQTQYNGIGGLVGVNSINSVNSLGNQYPDAGILPTDSLESARQKVSSAPSFQSQTPEGKADTESLITQQAYADTTTRSINNADKGFNQILSTFQNKGINDSNVPIANLFANKVKYNLGNEDLVAMRAGLQEVANEYQQVFARGGTVTNDVRDTSQSIIDGKLSLSALKKVNEELQAQGKVVIDGANSQVQAIQSRLKGQTQTSGGSSNSSTAWPGWNP